MASNNFAEFSSFLVFFVCQQTTVQNEEEAVKFVNYLWQSGSKFKKSNDSGKTAMNYAESNGLMKIIETLQYIKWKILYNRLQEACLISRNLASSKLFSYMASNNFAEFSSFLVFFEVDFPLFHFIIFARRLFIIISFVKYICSRRRGGKVY
jgi:hypothetical protein